MQIKKIPSPLNFSIVLGISLFVTMLSGCSDESQTHQSTTGFVKDSASSDTPVETLKTLTAEISAVQQQNQQLVAQNKALTEQDKNTLAQFKKDMMAQIEQQVTSAKNALQQTAQTSSTTSGETTKTASLPLGNSNGTSLNSVDTNGFIWIPDLQQASNNAATTAEKDKSRDSLATFINPGALDKVGSVSASDTVLNNYINHKGKPLAVPYYTIPVNATLTGAIAMQPIIGRIPIDGKVPDPYTFKAIIGSKNLAANGIDVPPDIQGIVASGVAEGDMLGKCARGEITSMTFVFQDGRISTTEAKNGQALGTIAAANGNPCIAGSFHTDAALFLGATAGLAGLQGYGNALSQAQLNTSTSATTGATISTLIGSANKYAFGQGFSSAAQAAQKWWDQRVQNSFDFVYVPNVDPKTKKKLELNVNITQEITIDYDPTKRRVAYEHQTKTDITPQLD
jgi:integrating conjugative element protein (TIGR03752 family)